ncbi:MAG: hypothetical protein IT558_01775 [Alphaproteobacteria bacterium]|nr:hypothetical protein [Alphaproteobacteria bacterium]
MTYIPLTHHKSSKRQQHGFDTPRRAFAQTAQNLHAEKALLVFIMAVNMGHNGPADISFLGLQKKSSEHKWDTLRTGIARNERPQIKAAKFMGDALSIKPQFVLKIEDEQLKGLAERQNIVVCQAFVPEEYTVKIPAGFESFSWLRPKNLRDHSVPEIKRAINVCGAHLASNWICINQKIQNRKIEQGLLYIPK